MSTKHYLLQAVKPSRTWLGVWHAVRRYEAEKMAPWVALRNTIGVLLPLAVGLATGHLATGILVCIGALNVAYSDSYAPYRQRAKRMLGACLCGSTAVCLGSLVGVYPLVAVLLATVGAFAAGMLIALGQAAADIGVISLVMLVVFSADRMQPSQAGWAGLAVLAGGLLQTGIAVAFWPLRRYEPERHALVEFYSQLSAIAAAPSDPQLSPPMTSQSTQAQEALASLRYDHTVEGERYRLLLSQAERIRLSLLALHRLQHHAQQEPTSAETVEAIGRVLAIASQSLLDISGSLQTHKTAPALGHQTELAGIAKMLRSQQEANDFAAAPGEVLSQVMALAGQLRAAADLAGSSTPQGELAFAEREARRPWRLQLGNQWATLRANLTLRSGSCRHAIRLAGCLLTGEAISLTAGLDRSYWLPMTIVIVLKPDFTTTFSRGVLRLAGTFGGLIVATVLSHFLPAIPVVQLSLIATFTFLLRWVGPANYGVFTAAISALIVVLLGLTGVAPSELVAARALNTALGGTLALLAYALWPTWERTQVAASLAQMLDAYRGYLEAVSDGHLEPGRQDLPLLLEERRLQARLARSNAEVSVDRLSMEPGTTPERLDLLSGMMASSHRFIHAVMALEAGLATPAATAAPNEFQRFAHDAELSLYYQANWLRKDVPSFSPLPDLRRSYHNLLSAMDGGSERHALLSAETDRIANSLNTLSGQVERWLR